MTATIRPGYDADADGFIALIGSCWSEYPGVLMDVDGENPELRALATHVARKGGALWVAEEGGAVIGMVATWPLQDGAWEIGKMYVAHHARGGGLAHRLVDAAEAHARTNGAMRLELWSDTRFDRAHRFYEKRSFVRAGAIRPLNDISHSIEFHYAKPLGPCAVERLDAAAAASAERRLAEVLVACAEAGAPVSYPPPLQLETARADWRRVAADVAVGKRIVLAAWTDGTLVGTVQLDLGMAPSQSHRAEVQMLFVQPDARRRGLGRALMQRIDVEARKVGRTLLTLHTRANDAAELLYRTTGWTEVGRIPGYTRKADGTVCEAVLFYKGL